MRPERSIVHALPIGYALDGQKGIKDPRGMVGEKLGVDVAVISAETLAMRNIELVLNRCHLQIEALVATPYASGLATLVDDEAQARRRAASTSAARRRPFRCSPKGSWSTPTPSPSAAIT